MNGQPHPSDGLTGSPPGVPPGQTAHPVAPGFAAYPAPVAQDTKQVVSRYDQMVYGIALTHTQCKGDADDVFQDVFLAYHRSNPRLRSEEHRKAWLIATTLNCAKRVAGSSWRTRVVPMTLEAVQDSAAEQFHFASEDQDAIFRAMKHLTEDQRIVVHLFYFEDLPVAEIAGLLSVEPAAVKMRLSRGRAAMKDELKGVLFDE